MRGLFIPRVFISEAGLVFFLIAILIVSAVMFIGFVNSNDEADKVVIASTAIGLVVFIGFGLAPVLSVVDVTPIVVLFLCCLVNVGLTYVWVQTRRQEYI